MLEYQILKALQEKPSHTQRSLAEKVGVSLGKINYALSGLVQKGVIKAKRIRNNPEKIRWNYILTPKGVEEKIQITKSYLNHRLNEFDKLKEEIALLRKEIARNE